MMDLSCLYFRNFWSIQKEIIQLIENICSVRHIKSGLDWTLS